MYTMIYIYISIVYTDSKGEKKAQPPVPPVSRCVERKHAVLTKKTMVLKNEAKYLIY